MNLIEIEFTASSPFDLKLEQYQGSAPNAYFDNIVISDSGFEPEGSSTPEPASALLMIVGVGTLLLRWRLRTASAGALAAGEPS
jgi:hypothetical protein